MGTVIKLGADFRKIMTVGKYVVLVALLAAAVAAQDDFSAETDDFLTPIGADVELAETEHAQLEQLKSEMMELKSENRQLKDEVVQLRSSQKGAVTWKLGPGGSSRDQVCPAAGGGCNQASLNALSSTSSFKAAFASAGYNCRGRINTACVGGRNCVNWGSPYIHSSHVGGGGSCQGGKVPSVAPCGQRPVDRHHRRLCPCTGAGGSGGKTPTKTHSHSPHKHTPPSVGGSVCKDNHSQTLCSNQKKKHQGCTTL